MTYEQLTIDQKITIKGWIETEGKEFKTDTTPFVVLKLIWELKDFKTAIQYFLIKYVNL